MRFDRQARTFDARAGLPDSACSEIASAVLALAGLVPDEALLELGAGTGGLGVELSRRWPRYLGLDASSAMLDEFRRRLEPGSRAELLQADAALPWPVESRSVRAILGSRVLHLLPAAHVADECLRVAGPRGAAVLIGRVRRDPESVRARMRGQMRELLRQAGFAVGGGRERRLSELTSRLGDAGAEPIEQRSVARWRVRHSPQQALDSWRAHQALAGVELEPRLHEQVLSQLSDWAKASFGSLEAAGESEEEYVLDGVRLPARPAAEPGDT